MSTGSVPLLWERNFTSNGCIHVLARYRASMATHMLNIKRIYDNPSDDDGYRILVDRIWPRGVSKERAKLDRWAKTEVTPTTDLRKWFISVQFYSNSTTDSYKPVFEYYNISVPSFYQHTGVSPIFLARSSMKA